MVDLSKLKRFAAPRKLGILVRYVRLLNTLNIVVVSYEDFYRALSKV